MLWRTMVAHCGTFVELANPLARFQSGAPSASLTAIRAQPLQLPRPPFHQTTSTHSGTPASIFQVAATRSGFCSNTEVELAGRGSVKVGWEGLGLLPQTNPHLRGMLFLTSASQSAIQVAAGTAIEQDGSKTKKGKKGKKGKKQKGAKTNKKGVDTAALSRSDTNLPDLNSVDLQSVNSDIDTEATFCDAEPLLPVDDIIEAVGDDIIGTVDAGSVQSSEVPSEPSNSAHREPSELARLCGKSVPDWLLRRAEDLGYSTPTGVQVEALPLALDGRDCVIHAQTGSGKTLTYLLPLLAGINPQRSAVQAIVVVPTRELGIQVARVARQLAGKGDDHVADEEAANTKKLKSGKIQVMALLDGAGGNRQKIWLKADPPHLVVGTPDRIHKMIEYRNLRTNGLKFVVVDEFDAYPAAMRTTGSLNKLLTIDSDASSRQTIFASATVPQHNRAVNELVKNKWARNDLVHVHVDPIQHVPKFLDHRYLVCEGDEKIAALQRLVDRDQPSAAIIFAHDITERDKRTGTCPSVEAVAEALSDGRPEALRPLLLQENARVQKRASIVQEFREGNRRLLVATDLAARGLDLPEVSHVYNFDLPLDATSYVHRAGRTARKPIAGTKGTVTCLVSTKEVFALKRLLNAIRVEGEEVDDTPG